MASPVFASVAACPVLPKARAVTKTPVSMRILFEATLYPPIPIAEDSVVLIAGTRAEDVHDLVRRHLRGAGERARSAGRLYNAALRRRQLWRCRGASGERAPAESRLPGVATRREGSTVSPSRKGGGTAGG